MHTLTPAATDTAVSDHTTSATSTQSHPYISTPTHTSRGKAPSSTSSLLSVPELAITEANILQGNLSTPPESPLTSKSTTSGNTKSNMDMETRSRAQARTYTPPSSPTRRSHSKSSSVSSTSIRDDLESLRRGMPTSMCSADDTEKPGRTEARQFPVWSADYQILVDEAGTQKIIGSGAWSTVYLANPTPAVSQEMDTKDTVVTSAELTPPLTPVHSRNSSAHKSATYPPTPSAYAVKVPSERTARRVLTTEGSILSYLSRFPSAEKYLVPYYGQDARTSALILGFVPATLDSLITLDLATRDESDRAAMLADLFPHIACNLLDGLAWLHDKGCIHADIKPANILVRTNPSTRTPTAVFADFSSSTLDAAHVPDDKEKPKLPLGGQTWDYMAPSLLSSSGVPTQASDAWSLAMTLLVLAAGVSPYERVAPNAVLKREILKRGAPLEHVSSGENGVRSVVRLGGLSRALGFNVRKWIGRVLVRDERERWALGEWREELGDALA